MTNNEEIIICSAIKTTDGTIFRGHRHSDCLRTAKSARRKYYEYGDGSTQGFITSKNRYVDRKEALKIQLAAGIKSVDKNGYREDELYSEDLY